MLHPGLYRGARINKDCYEWRNNAGELHNTNGPAKIKPMFGGANIVEFYVNGEKMDRNQFRFFYPNARL